MEREDALHWNPEMHDVRKGEIVTYIQRRGDGYLETVDEFETRKEARAMIAEYRMCDPTAEFYLSSRACKDWREERC